MARTIPSLPGKREKLGMTLIEITFAFGILAISIGILIEIIAAVSNGQTERWNHELALRKARDIVVAITSADNWEETVDYYDTLDGVEVIDEIGGAGWVKITVRVQIPPESSKWGRDATIVFGRSQ